jgi:signal transduction histidine kinase
VAGWQGAYLAWVRRHPLLADGALALVVLWVSGRPLTGIAGARLALALALVTAMALLLTFRRRAPFWVFTAVIVMALAEWFTDPSLVRDPAVLVAFYTVAAYQPVRQILFAAGTLLAGAVVAAPRATPGGGAFRGWLLLSALVAGTGLVGYFARTRRAYLDSLVDQEAELAASSERARIAREMHDIVAHNIAVMIALSDGAAYTAADNPEQAASLMAQVSATGRAALTETRRLLGVLRQAPGAGHAPQPTLADIDELVASVRAAGLPTRLTVTGQPFALPPSAQLALYRMIQEALTNTLKHAAGVTSAEVRLSYRPGEVGLEVTDDGRPAGLPEGGHGVAGMRERAAVFGGEVTAGPRAGGGWRVHTVLHVDPTPAGTAPGNSAPAAGKEHA